MKTDRLPIVLIDFWLACTLLSRLPLPHLPETAFLGGARAVWAYPLAGVLLGTIAGCFGVALYAMGLPTMYASGVTLGVLILTTGAMHEDGLADTADGFWGGFDPARRLEIMKDSAIGTYGVLALILVTGLRWIAYGALLPFGILPIIAVAALSRATMPLVMASLPHARASGLSHSVGRPGALPCIAGLVGALLIAGAAIGPLAILCLTTTIAVSVAISLCAKTKIGGQTGDVLGATQQLSEVAILGVLLIALT